MIHVLPTGTLAMPFSLEECRAEAGVRRSNPAKSPQASLSDVPSNDLDEFRDVFQSSYVQQVPQVTRNGRERDRHSECEAADCDGNEGPQTQQSRPGYRVILD